MNLPNKLTVLRVIMIPFFVVSLLAFHGDFVPCGESGLFQPVPL